MSKIGNGAFAHCASLERKVIPNQLDLNFFANPCSTMFPPLSKSFLKKAEIITGYSLIQTDADLEIIVPKSVTEFSPYVFLINPSANTKITFLGKFPEITDDTSWVGSPTIYYDTLTTGWDAFIWNKKFEMKPILD